MINAQLIKQLRDLTQAGMLDCKKALEANDGNVEKAVVWLREKGIAKAEKKAASRVAAEGLCSYAISGNKAVYFELNSETDFVAKNDKFVNLVNKIGETLVNSNATNTEEALNVIVDGTTLANVILQNAGVIGEKISLRRVGVLTKNDDEVFGAYKHNGGNILSLVVLKGNDEVVAKDVAMHVAAQAPTYVSKKDIPAEALAKEEEIILQTALNENKQAAKPKPENIIKEKIVPGRLEKELKDICLLSQPFVKNPDQTVEQYVAANKSSVVTFVRLRVGEGIEKETVDFAAEVAAQAGLNK